MSAADSPPIAVVTGASSGFGYATALHLARNGWHVMAGIRTLAKAAALEAAAAEANLPVTIVPLDVTSDESVSAAFATVAESGPVDVLVNNAGISGGGPFEMTTDEANRAMFETNYFGAVRCMRAVLPAMRERGHGAIVNITSLSALFPWPNQACYSASKWALEGLSGALAHEVFRFGIRVVNIQPGAIRTDIVANSKERTYFDRESPYAPIMRRNGKLISAGFRSGATAQDVAIAVHESITTPHHRLQWPVGSDAEAVLRRRDKVSVDEFVAMGGDTSDDEYRTWFSEQFGIDL